MNFLAIDCSNKHLIISACKNDVVQSVFIADCRQNHSEVLLENIDLLLKKANLLLSECDFFGVCNGPGSFTGIRIGIATVKAFAQTRGRPVKCVTAFDVLTYNRVRRGSLCACPQAVMAAVDAVEGFYYVQGFKNSVETVKPCYISKPQLFEYSKDYTVLSQKKIEGLSSEVIDIEKQFSAIMHSSMSDIIQLEKAECFYIQKSQAEAQRENANK